MNIPVKFNQGDTFTWTDRTSQVRGSDIKDGEWNLVVSFRGPVAIDLSAARVDGCFTFQVDKTQAQRFSHGRYRWVAKLQHIDQPSTPFLKQVIGDLLVGSYDVTNCDDLTGVEPGMFVRGDFFSTDTMITSVDPSTNTMSLDKPILIESNLYQCQVESAPVETSPFDGYSQTLQEGTVDVLPDITTFGNGYDARTQTEKDLEAVDEAIRAMISGGAVQEYQIGNRSVKKMSLEALQTLRSRLQYQLARERKARNIAAGNPDPSNVLVRFTR